jgi:hypothetical protein
LRRRKEQVEGHGKNGRRNYQVPKGLIQREEKVEKKKLMKRRRKGKKGQEEGCKRDWWRDKEATNGGEWDVDGGRRRRSLLHEYHAGAGAARGLLWS